MLRRKPTPIENFEMMLLSMSAIFFLIIGFMAVFDAAEMLNESYFGGWLTTALMGLGFILLGVIFGVTSLQNLIRNLK